MCITVCTGFHPPTQLASMTANRQIAWGNVGSPYTRRIHTVNCGIVHKHSGSCAGLSLHSPPQFVIYIPVYNASSVHCTENAALFTWGQLITLGTLHLREDTSAFWTRSSTETTCHVLCIWLLHVRTYVSTLTADWMFSRWLHDVINVTRGRNYFLSTQKVGFRSS